MNKYGETLFFARPPSEDDEIYCPYCGAAYEGDCRFGCGLSIFRQKPVFAEGKEKGFNCVVRYICPIRVADMSKDQMRARVKTMLQLPLQSVKG